MVENLLLVHNMQPIDAVLGLGLLWRSLRVEHSDDLLRQLEDFSSDRTDRREEFYCALTSVVKSMKQQGVVDTAQNASPTSSLTHSTGTASTSVVPNVSDGGALATAVVLGNAGGTSTTDGDVSNAASVASDGLASVTTTLPNSIGTFAVDGDVSTTAGTASLV
jgi:hypothetical protein